MEELKNNSLLELGQKSILGEDLLSGVKEYYREGSSSNIEAYLIEQQRMPVSSTSRYQMVYYRESGKNVERDPF